MQHTDSPRALMALQAATLYRLDGDRLLCVNEPSAPAAPLLFLGRTAEGNLWRFRADVPPAVQAVAAQLCQAEPVVNDWHAPPRHAAAIMEALSAYQPVHLGWRGPAYHVPASVDRADSAVLINAANTHVLRAAFPYLVQGWQDVQPCLALVVDGQAVAVCCSSRSTPHAAEAGLETSPAHRGRGYARAVVAAWAAAVRHSGRTPLYSTSWDNLASQGVARSLGLRCYGEDCSFGAVEG